MMADGWMLDVGCRSVAKIPISHRGWMSERSGDPDFTSGLDAGCRSVAKIPISHRG